MQKPERDLLEVQTALAAHHLLRLVQGAYAALPRSRDCCHLALERRLTQLHKVLNDEFTFVLDEQSVCVQASQRSKHEKGVYAIGSAVDPEATFRQHRNRNDFCYNIGIDATKRFIRETSATTGATPDSKLVAPGIEAQKQQIGGLETHRLDLIKNLIRNILLFGRIKMCLIHGKSLNLLLCTGQQKGLTVFVMIWPKWFRMSFGAI